MLLFLTCLDYSDIYGAQIRNSNEVRLAQLRNGRHHETDHRLIWIRSIDKMVPISWAPPDALRKISAP